MSFFTTDLTDLRIFEDFFMYPAVRSAVKAGVVPSVGRGSLDHATLGYLGVIRATGVTVTSTQQSAIDAFIVAEKDAGRWDSHKRLYLPIWGNAAANAICMKTCTSGTFVNSPTHAAGYVQGNGLTSYFNTGISPSTAGFTSTSGSLFALVVQADSRTDARHYIGARNATSDSYGACSIYQGGATTMFTMIGLRPDTPFASLTVAFRVGIFHSNRNLAQGLIMSQRRSYVIRSAASRGNGGITSTPFTVMAFNLGSQQAMHTDARFGAYGLGLGLANDVAVDAFTSNLKTLWETCTGLSLT